MAVIKSKYETVVEPTITTTSIANADGRISDVIDNTTTKATRGLVAFQMKTGGTGPTANGLFKLYLIRQTNGSTNIRAASNALGDADALVANEPWNSYLVGTITVTTATETTYSEIYPVYDPGPKFSFVIWNQTGQASSATPVTPALQWVPITDEIV